MNYQMTCSYSGEESNILVKGGVNKQCTYSSFWLFLKTSYSLSEVFLPNYLPYNNVITNSEKIELQEMIIERDHYAIKEIIKSRYSKNQNDFFELSKN